MERRTFIASLGSLALAQALPPLAPVVATPTIGPVFKVEALDGWTMRVTNLTDKPQAFSMTMDLDGNARVHG
jgi:hypothetical protein